MRGGKIFHYLLVAPPYSSCHSFLYGSNIVSGASRQNKCLYGRSVPVGSGAI